MVRRVDLIKTFLEEEEYLFDKVCPVCYHLLEATMEGLLYCSNEMCLNEQQYPPAGMSEETFKSLTED